MRAAARAVGSRPAPAITALAAILGLALGLRLLAVLVTPGYVPFGDAADYDRIGRWIADLGSFPPTTFAEPGGPAALRPPAFPLLLGGLYEVIGIRWTLIRGVEALLGTLSVALVWAIVRRLADERLALVSAAVAAVLPSLVWLSGGLVAEALFVPAVLAAVWAALRHRDAAGRGWVLAAGLLLGLAVLTRTNGAILLLPLLVAAWLPRRRVADPLVLLLGFAVALAPWTVRNARAFDAFAPLGTQSGYTIAGAFNAQAAGSGPLYAAWRVPDTLPELAPLLGRPGTDEADVDAELRDRGVRFAVKRPGFVVGSTAVHGLQLLHLWPGMYEDGRAGESSFREAGVPPVLWGSSVLAFWALLAAAAGGAAVLARRRAALAPWWFWAVPVLIVASVAPLLGPPRYRIPADPFLAILAAVALLAVRDRWAVRRRRPSARVDAGEPPPRQPRPPRPPRP